MGQETSPEPKSAGLRVLELLGDEYVQFKDRPTGFEIDGQDSSVEAYLTGSPHTAQYVAVIVGMEDNPAAFAGLASQRDAILTALKNGIKHYIPEARTLE